MNDQKARELVMALLDDNYGISEDAYKKLIPFMKKFKLDNIWNQVVGDNGRFYIGPMHNGRNLF